MRSIDLNCDLGEGSPHDAELIALVSSVNVACGGHAGDDDTMRNAVRLAADAGVNVGAHPGYEDRANFGRVELPLPPEAVRDLVRRQVDRLRTLADREGVTLFHVKPHGALYHAATRDAAIAAAVMDGIDDATLAVVGPPAGQLRLAAARAGRRYVREGFIDRRYQPDGTLVPRGHADAVLTDAHAAARQAVSIAVEGKVITVTGESVALDVDTLCAHGDGATARDVLRAVKDALREGGLVIRRPARTPPSDTARSAG